MKTLVIGLLVLGSVSIWANERGMCSFKHGVVDISVLGISSETGNAPGYSIIKTIPMVGGGVQGQQIKLEKCLAKVAESQRRKYIFGEQANITEVKFKTDDGIAKYIVIKQN